MNVLIAMCNASKSLTNQKFNGDEKMKKTNFMKKIISGILMFCMMASFPLGAFANNGGIVYADFEAQKAVIEQINSNYGLSIEIYPLSDAEMETAEPVILSEFIAFMTDYAEAQYALKKMLDETELEKEILRPMPRHGTFLGNRDYSAGHTHVITSSHNISVAGQITVSTWTFNNLVHAHSATHKSVSVSSSLPSFVHFRTSFNGLSINSDGREILAMYSSEVSWGTGLAYFYEPSLTTYIRYNIW